MLKGAASGLKSVASSYAKDIVNEIMDDGDDHESNPSTDKNGSKEIKDNSAKNISVDTSNFFASFIPENIKKVEATLPKPSKSETNPFRTASAQNQQNSEPQPEHPKIQKSDEENKGKISKDKNLTPESKEKDSKETVSQIHLKPEIEEIKVSQENVKLEKWPNELSVEHNQLNNNNNNQTHSNIDKETIQRRTNKLEWIHNKLVLLIDRWSNINIPVSQQNVLLNFDSIQMSSPSKEKAVEDETSQSPSKNISTDSVGLIEGAMQKFDKFWSEMLEKYEKVVSSEMNPNVPDFERLFKSLERPEKRHFKPFLKILAHSLQFLDKLQTQSNKLESLKSEVKSNALALEVEKSKLLEKQILKLQNNCKDFIMSEDTMKKQLNYMQEKNKELEEDLEKSANDLIELK